MTAKTVTGQVSPDRVSALEAEVAQLKIRMAELRHDVLTVEGVARDLGHLMIQMMETQREGIAESAKMAAHLRHDDAYRASPGAVFCFYCTRVEGS